MSPLHDRIARNIRDLAATQRIPISHVADRAAVSRRQLWRVLRGTASPTVDWLEKVAGALHADVIRLLRDEVSALPPKRSR